MTITPTSATVGAAESRTLTATVANASNTAVVWEASGGTISGTGASVTWTAPVTAGQYTVTVKSAEDQSKSASATLTVPPVQLSLTVGSTTLARRQVTTLPASLSGTNASGGVTWTTTCGQVEPNGAGATFTAPASPGECDVTATSALSAAWTASARLTVRNGMVVTTDDDVNDGACTWEHCSLRDAIVAANTEPGADTIFLSPGAVNAAAAGSQAAAVVAAAIAPIASLPIITEDLALIGEGASTTEIDMGASPGDPRRALEITAEIQPTAVTVQGVTIRNAVAAGGPAALVRNGAVLRLVDVVLPDNVSLAAGGGAIRGLNIGAITLTDTEITNNRIQGGSSGGGGIFVDNPAGPQGVIVIDGATIANNRVEGVAGGGILLANNLDVSISNSTIAENEVPDGVGGGISMAGSSVNLSGTNVEIRDNEAIAAGGIYFAGTVLLLTGSIVDGNTATELSGGGIFAEQSGAITITSSTLSNNTAAAVAGSGGGLFAFDPVVLQIIGTTVAGNSAGSAGGGLWFRGPTAMDRSVVAGNTAGVNGGGISAGSNALILGSTIVGNSAGTNGGGIFAVASAQSPTQVVNSTLSGNTAANGGGFVGVSWGDLLNVTVIGNSATNRGGGVVASNANGPGTVRLINTLLSGNTGPSNSGNCYESETFGGTLETEGGNLSDDTSCTMFGGSDKSNTAAGVSPTPAANGGSTPTHALQAGSAAIGAAIHVLCPTTDQRGFDRDGACDAGAFEFGATAAGLP